MSLHKPHAHLSPKEWVGFMAMVVGMFMAILDIQIVASSLTQIQAGLSASPDEIIWVQSAYLIAEVIMIPLSGWLSRAFSTRVLFTVSCVGFTLMSLGCALAWNLDSMIVFRTLQGFIGGAMIPTVFASIFILFPPAMRPAMTVVIGLVVTVAPTAGPVLGGWLTDLSSWHAMFLINVVPGIIVSVLTWLYVHIDEPEPGLLKKIDFPGIIYIALFLGSLQYVLEEGVRKDWLNDTSILVFGLVAFVFGGVTFWRELRTPHPIIDLYAFADRNFAVGCLYSFVIGWGLYTAVSLQPQFLAQVRGFNSFQIGVYLTVTGLAQLASAPLAGILSKKIDLRLMLAMGLMLFGTGVWLNGHLTADAGFWDLFWPQAIRGLSLMFCFVPINTLALGTLPPSHVKNASGLYNLMRNLGGAIGLAVTATLQLRWNHDALGALRENVTAGNPAVQGFTENLAARMEMFPLPDASTAALKMLSNTALREAAVVVYNDLFMLMALLFWGALAFIVFVKKVDPSASPKEAH